MTDLLQNSTRIEYPHYHAGVTSGELMVMDFRTTDALEVASIVALISNVNSPEQSTERHYFNTVETMLWLEQTGSYVVTTATDSIDGLVGTAVKCYGRCLPSPSLN